VVRSLKSKILPGLCQDRQGCPRRRQRYRHHPQADQAEGGKFEDSDESQGVYPRNKEEEVLLIRVKDHYRLSPITFSWRSSLPDSYYYCRDGFSLLFYRQNLAFSCSMEFAVGIAEVYHFPAFTFPSNKFRNRLLIVYQDKS
jgi:hypothetical protein